MRNSDLFATGSVDDYVNLYKYNKDAVLIEKIKRIPLAGSINAMSFADNGNVLLCAQAADQRLGRWITNNKSKSGVTIFTNILPNISSE